MRCVNRHALVCFYCPHVGKHVSALFFSSSKVELYFVHIKLVSHVHGCSIILRWLLLYSGDGSDVAGKLLDEIIGGDQLLYGQKHDVTLLHLDESRSSISMRSAAPSRKYLVAALCR
ncbi:hypothetical protein L1887_22438 [Cichorium endivia]|nr:hypothetical protein L1887_22438 [Cichorium endivia]